MSAAGGPRSGTGSGHEQRVLEIIETARAKRPRFREERITVAHGAGGKASQTLIEGLLVATFCPGGSGALAALADAGVLRAGQRRVAISTDSVVVRPLPSRAGRSGSWESTAP